MAPVDSSSASQGYGNNGISPLPSGLHHGYIALAFTGFLSFFSTSALLGFLTWRLIRWRKSGYNQFILLIYNLVLADTQQAIAFFLNARWAHMNAMQVGTSTCFAQGWFISVGQLGTGVWIFTIACHTFAAVVLDYRLNRIQFGIVITALWSFIYLCAIIGVASHPKDIYELAGAWCWINPKYASLRLWLHYFWIFISMFASTFIYITIYIVIMRRLKANYYNTSAALAEQANRVAKYMVIYPFAYVICTLPIAAGRMAAMTGVHISYPYYIFAGIMITSNGWVDVFLYTLTRRVIVFSDTPPVDDCGLETFGILRSKDGFGNHVEISGGVPAGVRPRNKRNAAQKGIMKDLPPLKLAFKTTTVTVESHRRPVADLERLRLPTAIASDDDFGWDSTTSDSLSK